MKKRMNKCLGERKTENMNVWKQRQLREKFQKTLKQ